MRSHGFLIKRRNSRNRIRYVNHMCILCRSQKEIHPLLLPEWRRFFLEKEMGIVSSSETFFLQRFSIFLNFLLASQDSRLISAQLRRTHNRGESFSIISLQRRSPWKSSLHIRKQNISDMNQPIKICQHLCAYTTEFMYRMC